MAGFLVRILYISYIGRLRVCAYPIEDIYMKLGCKLVHVVANVCLIH